MFKDVFRCSQMFKDVFRYSKMFLDVLFIFFTCSLHVLRMFSGCSHDILGLVGHLSLEGLVGMVGLMGLVGLLGQISGI